MKRQPPLYDRRRLETLVTAHKMQVHRMTKAGKNHRPTAGVKAPR